MADRQRASAIAQAARTKATVTRLEKMLADARQRHDQAKLKAIDAGVSMTELGRILGTSTTRVSRTVKKARLRASA
jgi:hypothetical protein